MATQFASKGSEQVTTHVKADCIIKGMFKISRFVVHISPNEHPKHEMITQIFQV